VVTVNATARRPQLCQQNRSLGRVDCICLIHHYGHRLLPVSDERAPRAGIFTVQSHVCEQVSQGAYWGRGLKTVALEKEEKVEFFGGELKQIRHTPGGHPCCCPCPPCPCCCCPCCCFCCLCCLRNSTVVSRRSMHRDKVAAGSGEQRVTIKYSSEGSACHVNFLSEQPAHQGTSVNISRMSQGALVLHTHRKKTLLETARPSSRVKAYHTAVLREARQLPQTPGTEVRARVGSGALDLIAAAPRRWSANFPSGCKKPSRLSSAMFATGSGVRSGQS
jgi:hypothetical protein